MEQSYEMFAIFNVYFVIGIPWFDEPLIEYETCLCISGI